MAMTKRNGKNDTIILNTIEELVPQDHDVRMLDNCIDWSFIYPLVENLYSDVGRPSLGKNSEITGTGYLFDPFLSSSEHAVPMKVLESNRTQIIIELNSFFIFIFY